MNNDVTQNKETAVQNIGIHVGHVDFRKPTL